MYPNKEVIGVFLDEANALISLICNTCGRHSNLSIVLQVSLSVPLQNLVCHIKMVLHCGLLIHLFFFHYLKFEILHAVCTIFTVEYQKESTFFPFLSMCFKLLVVSGAYLYDPYSM